MLSLVFLYCKAVTSYLDFFQNNICDTFLSRHDTGIISLFSHQQSLSKNNPDIGPDSAICCIYAAGLNPDWVDVQYATIFHKILSCILDSILRSAEWYSKSLITYKRVKEIGHNCVWLSQTTFSDVFSGMKSFVFRFKFHWSLFPWVQLTITHHCFK